jgi:hypothetical protein
MAKTKQKAVTISGKKVLEVLERYYKEESDKKACIVSHLLNFLQDMRYGILKEKKEKEKEEEKMQENNSNELN